MSEHDGIDGTDNVRPLFPERPSAAPIPPQSDIAAILEEYMLAATSGHITGLMIIGFNTQGGFGEAIGGKVPFQAGVSALEKMKFNVMFRDMIAAQQPK